MTNTGLQQVEARTPHRWRHRCTVGTYVMMHTNMNNNPFTYIYIQTNLSNRRTPQIDHSSILIALFKHPKPTTSLNRPIKIGAMVGRFRQSLLYSRMRFTSQSELSLSPVCRLEIWASWVRALVESNQEIKDRYLWPHSRALNIPSILQGAVAWGNLIVYH